MVEAFFGFKKIPFSDCPDAKQLFASQAWNQVNARLQFLVDHRHTRALRVHWQHASRLLLDEVRPAALTCQVQVALFMDGKLDDDAFRHLSSARRWRRHATA